MPRETYQCSEECMSWQEQNKGTLEVSRWTMNPVPLLLASADENVVSL